jgi:hypothetical protein
VFQAVLKSLSAARLTQKTFTEMERDVPTAIVFCPLDQHKRNLLQRRIVH